MMTNIFQPFDPSTSIFKMNFLMLTIPLVVIYYPQFTSTKKNLILKIHKMVEKEFSPILPIKSKNNMNFLISIFFMISILNFSSLMPFNFTITSQISFTFPMAISFWLIYMVFGWSKKPIFMMKHLIPTGTPSILIPIMIMIEIISQLIRPITLAVRLTANMTAGHLLMELLGNFALINYQNMMISLMAILILSMLEMCVSIIQAYVFSSLIALYLSETLN